MNQHITVQEIAELIMVSTSSVHQIVKRRKDFPPVVGKLPVDGGGNFNLYDRKHVMDWLRKNRPKHLGKEQPFLNSAKVCELLGIERANFAHFRNKYHDFPKAAHTKGTHYYFDKKHVQEWIDNHKNDWNVAESDFITYTTPAMREKFTAPKTMLFDFISGKYK